MAIERVDISESEQTPLVRRLLEIIQEQSEEIDQLRAEIAHLKGLSPKPKITPSKLEQPPPSAPLPPTDGKRPGSAKRFKTAQLTIHADEILKLDNVPAGSVFKGYEDFVVQDIIIKPHNTRYRRERWLTPTGVTIVAGLPAKVLPGSHFGPELICHILHQYHCNHVTQPLILEELHQRGIDISAGQIDRILTQDKDAFHQEKNDLLPAGLESSAYIHVDDTGARHDGKQGYCTHIGNEFFAYFQSTPSKSRVNFLEVLRGTHQDYVLDEVAMDYFAQQKLPQTLRAALDAGPHHFADKPAWEAHLNALGITSEHHVRTATEGALLGSLVSHGTSLELVIMSDDAGQFAILVHILCWIHAERTLARLIPFNERYRQALEKVRTEIWEFYARLKAYKKEPTEELKLALDAEFDRLFSQKTNFTTINAALRRLAANKSELLLVLERPELPLHNNLSEGDIRDYVKRRKISGGTRSDEGKRCRDTFASLKKTCRKLGIAFWDYLCDRVRGLGQIPQLGQIVRERAKAKADEGAKDTETSKAAETLVPA
jgi:transposase IS66 family protein